MNQAAGVIYENVDSEAQIIFGALIDPEMEEGEMSITVLATGFGLSISDVIEVRGAASQGNGRP